MDNIKDYKYLEAHTDKELVWAKNAATLYKKDQSSHDFMRLRSINVSQTLLRIFNDSAVASLVLHAVACWDSSLRVAKNKWS